MAHGIKQGMLLTAPKIWGKLLENEGAAWIEAKWILPILSLARGKLHDIGYAHMTHDSLNPKVALTWL